MKRFVDQVVVITGARGAGRNDKMTCGMAELRTRYASNPDAAQLVAQAVARHGKHPQ